VKITQEEIVDGQTTLHVELEDSDLGPYLDQGYQRMSQRIVIPGFRQGKAPRRIVEGFVGRESLLNEVLDKMVSEVIGQAIKEQDLDAVGTPQIQDLDLDPVQFKATIPLRPEVRLGDYRSIRVDFQVDEITDDDVSDRIDSIRESLGTWETVERSPEFKDLISLDFRGSVEGEVIWDREDSTLYLDEEGRIPIPGFTAEMVGAETNEEIEFTLQVPEEYSDASIAGKEAHFSATVNDVKERVLPELNDEFAQNLPDNFEDLNALRTTVEESLKENTEQQADQRYQTEVIEALLDETTIELPPVLLEREADHIEHDQDSFLERAGIRRDDYLRSIGSTEEEVHQQAVDEAANRLKRSFAINRIAELEGVEATEPEIDEQFNQIFAGQPLRRQEREERRASIERMLKYDKTVELLVEIAKGEHASGDTQNEPNDSGSGDPEGGHIEDDSKA
jgi:trigger factor